MMYYFGSYISRSYFLIISHHCWSFVSIGPWLATFCFSQSFMIRIPVSFSGEKANNFSISLSLSCEELFFFFKAITNLGWLKRSLSWLTWAWSQLLGLLKFTSLIALILVTVYHFSLPILQRVSVYSFHIPNFCLK